MTISLQIYNLHELAVYMNVGFEYFLPPFLSLISECSACDGFLKTDNGCLKYTVSRPLFLVCVHDAQLKTYTEFKRIENSIELKFLPKVENL